MNRGNYGEVAYRLPVGDPAIRYEVIIRKWQESITYSPTKYIQQSGNYTYFSNGTSHSGTTPTTFLVQGYISDCYSVFLDFGSNVTYKLLQVGSRRHQFFPIPQ